MVLKLKADLEKAKVVTRTIEEDVEASSQAFYNLGVEETEIRLAEELAEVCRDYCKEVWIKALNLAGVPATLEWRQDECVYYPHDICEVPAALLSPSTFAPKSFKQPLITQALLPLFKASK